MQGSEIVIYVLAFFSSFFLFLVLSELYFRWRYKKILKFADKSDRYPTIHEIYLAQKKFWIWPIKKAFK